MRRWVIVAAALAGAGCGDGGGGGGGGSPGPASGTALTVTGTLAFVAGNAAAVRQEASCDVGGGVTYGFAYAALLASDQTGICGYLERNENKASARSIQLAVVRVDPTDASTSVTNGSYPILTDPGLETEFAQVVVSQNDATCDPSDVEATGGTVTITSTEGGRLQGTIDATLADGGAITGRFDAEGCDVTFEGDACAGELGPQDPRCAE